MDTDSSPLKPHRLCTCNEHLSSLYVSMMELHQLHILLQLCLLTSRDHIVSLHLSIAAFLHSTLRMQGLAAIPLMIDVYSPLLCCRFTCAYCTLRSLQVHSSPVWFESAPGVLDLVIRCSCAFPHSSVCIYACSESACSSEYQTIAVLPSRMLLKGSHLMAVREQCTSNTHMLYLYSVFEATAVS